MPTQIVFNGVTYTSVDAMPPEVRRAYEAAMSVFADRDQNGLPDIFEGQVPQADSNGMVVTTGPAVQLTSSSHIIVNGQAYNSVEEMPPDVRRTYEEAMHALVDQNRDGVPDVLEGTFLSNLVKMPTPGAAPAQSASPMPRAQPIAPQAASEAGGDRVRRAILIGAGLLLAVSVVFVAAFLLLTYLLR